MANLFELALINPIRLIKIDPVLDGRYYYAHFDNDFSHNLIPNFQSKACYFQKYTTLDSTKIQVLSDFPDMSLSIINLNTGQTTVPDIELIEMVSTIENQTFKVYEALLDFTLLDEGEYYVELTYEDGDTITYQSEPVSIRNEHENTILLEYTHSENNYSVVFTTGIIFSLRIEGAIKDFKPEANRTVYDDQMVNTTLLSAVPFRGFTVYFGDEAGIPDWMADKINRVLACDSVRYDGDYYQVIEGAKWETKRAEDYPFLWLTIDIRPTDNRFLELNPGIDPDGGISAVQKVLKYLDNSNDITIENVFKKFTLLEKIYIFRSGDVFTLLVGTTPGGSEIGTFDINETLQTLNINHGFIEPTTVYLTGPDETTSDIIIIYKQLDEKPVSSTPGSDGLRLGMVFEYSEVEAGDLDVDFNLASGLGNPDGNYPDCAICDGRNNTPDKRGRFSVMYEDGNANYGIIGEPGGQESFKITNTDNLPKIQLKVLANTEVTVPGGVAVPSADKYLAFRGVNDGSWNYSIRPTTTPATVGLTSSVGLADPTAITHIPKYIVSLFVKKIV